MKSKRIYLAMGLCAFVGVVGCGSGSDDLAVDTIEAQEQDLSGYGVEVKCVAKNQFGYVATVNGTLRLTKHDFPQGFLVKGKLKVQTAQYGQPFKNAKFKVTGDLDVTGHYAFVEPPPGKPIKHINLVFGPADSSVNTSNISYQTDCSQSLVKLPKGSDLVLEHTMRHYPNGNGQIGVQIDVVNIGNKPAHAPSGQVNVAGITVNGALYQYYGGTADPGANTVNPGERGYIKVLLPSGTLARCNQYDVKIDLGHTMQSGQPNPFGNDAGKARTPCLKWNTPITSFEITSEPDPLIKNHSLAEIVSSKWVARSDGKLCNACHFVGSGKPYSPPAGDIAYNQTVGAGTWETKWAAEFIGQGIKPQYLKDAFQQWLNDGSL